MVQAHRKKNSAAALRSRELIRRDLSQIWHPYTQMRDCRTLPPIPVSRGSGVKLYDLEGKFYYDTISSWWCNVHGHNHPKIKAAIKRQLDTLEHVLFAGFTHEPAVRCAEELMRVAPPRLRKVFFSDNGSTAVEAALKMSFQYWRNIGERGRTKFVSLDRGYHGDTVGAMSVGGKSAFNEAFEPLFFPSYKVPSPYCYRCPMGLSRETCAIDCARPLERLLAERASGIAAIVIEPMMLGAAGIIVYPREYLMKVAGYARRYGVHVILDEVAVGFGRTGKMFAAEYVGDFADFLCLSKGITSGYLPLAATLTTDAVYRAFYAEYSQNKTFFHGHTYTANPLACSAAVASLMLFREARVLEKADDLAAHFHRRLDEFAAYRNVGDIRRIGLIGALELVKDRRTKEEFAARLRIGRKVYERGLGSNLILRPLGSVIYFFLPLCIKRCELDDVLDRTHDVLREVFS